MLTLTFLLALLQLSSALSQNHGSQTSHRRRSVCRPRGTSVKPAPIPSSTPVPTVPVLNSTATVPPATTPVVAPNVTVTAPETTPPAVSPVVTPPLSHGSWTKTADIRGESFSDFFNFETVNGGAQGGIAQYVGLDEAKSSGLMQIMGDSVKLGVDTTKYVGGTRKSIRISSKSTFGAGTMIVIDVQHMPSACGAWPALWTVAPDDSWPQKGELDIVEGVSLFTQNAISAHTKPGFVMEQTGFTSGFMLGTDLKSTCAVALTDNEGCGLRDKDKSSFGAPFNGKQGGAYVLDWTEEAISVYFFPRGSIPQDIQQGAPSSSASWRSSIPKAKFRDVSGQKTSDYFVEHVLVFNTNLCGKWPESLWHSAAAYAGQDSSCAALTGFDSCSDYVLNAGDQLGEAYWTINSIEMYK